MKRILAVSDLHCGSIYGMLPPDFVSSDGRKVPPNGGQQHLWKCWEHAATTMGHIDALVIDGDAIDGEQHRSRGTELCLPRLEDQTEAATTCLRALIKSVHNPPRYVVSGTPYHDSPGGREAEVMAQRLDAEKYRSAGPGRYCNELLDLEVEGVILNFMHGISVSSGLYRATAPDREALWSALAGKEGKSARADCLIRAHAHYFTHVEHPTKHAVILPCWQLQTSYMRRNSAYRMVPDIGYVIVEVDGKVKQQGGDPCRVIKKLYPLPSPKVTCL